MKTTLLSILLVAGLVTSGCATYHRPPGFWVPKTGPYKTMAECRAAHATTPDLCVETHGAGMRVEPAGKSRSPAAQLGWDALMGLYLWR